MPSSIIWQRNDATLALSGHWMHDAVASAMPKIATKDIACVNVRDVSGLDSSFLTLLLRLLSDNASLSLVGVSSDMLALMKLYGIDAFFQIESHV